MPPSTLSNANLYLDLLRDVITRTAIPETWTPMVYPKGTWRSWVMGPFQKLLELRGYYLCQRYNYTVERRTFGLDWPPEAETMVGLTRLENLRRCCTTAVQENIPGDFCETGVWRGGSCIYMRAILKALAEPTKNVWVCDSFQGLPKPTHKEDEGLDASIYPQLSISLDQVKSNFARYGLLDDRVKFIKGWFRDTLPAVPIQQLSVLRLDGDLYESTWDAMTNLYPKLSKGGFLIIDDYDIPQCRKAIHDYRKKYGVEEPIEQIDANGSFWRRSF